ncbi:SWIM zinc finger family protein [Streptomyces virginiae]|uniref:SWIM zinc finger family protein n=1 Tax=Streptomyces virginiae TaxID=1961 RepID=UPI002259ABF5|nr:SWF or SNF family helicase [Streptomyces virginiae]MCX4721193.1 SWF or SNF family helicase [Streptomyces virginiae]MCX5275706.1 SWF or SNF family helicase [Streptomyces virginiae]
MNTRDRHREPYEKTFPAVAPTRGRGFAHTWWGHAWVRALEDSALDGTQLKQGRRYARSGAVGAMSVRPGGLTAVVRDPDGTAHRTDVLVQEFTEAEWNRLLDLAAAEARHIAALLDREVPPELAEDATAAGVELLPGIGDLDPRCDCGEWDHCAHTAALCYQVARLLDQDPFVLLLLRGRGERELVDDLAERSTAEAEAEADAPHGFADDGVPAAEVFAVGAPRPALPPLPALPETPGQPPALDTEAEPEPHLDVDAVEFLAQAAATEAHRRLAEALAPGHADRAPTAPLSLAEDAVRLTAEADDFRVRSRLAAATGRSRAEMELAVRAWGFGAAPGLAALEDDWTPDRSTLDRARAALTTAWADGEPPVLRRVRARWTQVGTDRQLRLGREGRWWPYRREAGRWIPSGPSAPDPGSALEADPAP